MCKMLEATCSSNGVVTADGVAVPSAQILSKGTKASSGALLLEGEKAKYLTSNASDIEDLITRVVSIVDKLSEILTAFDGALGGSQAANLTALTTLRGQLNSSKATLK